MAWIVKIFTSKVAFKVISTLSVPLRNQPTIFNGSNDTFLLKNWLCDPQSRQNDVCILTKDHYCNGIEVELVVYILPGDCPLCHTSNADPVIVSRNVFLPDEFLNYRLGLVAYPIIKVIGRLEFEDDLRPESPR